MPNIRNLLIYECQNYSIKDFINMTQTIKLNTNFQLLPLLNSFLSQPSGIMDLHIETIILGLEIKVCKSCCTFRNIAATTVKQHITVVYSLVVLENFIPWGIFRLPGIRTFQFKKSDKKIYQNS